MGSVDLLKNRAPLRPLGPFDGQVGALARLRGETYFITTNTDYIPSLPSLEVPHALFLRSDMRYGTDDPTLWPQQWTARYCHFPAIAKKGSRPELEVMWRDPTQSDFVAGSAVTRGLECLHSSILGKLLIPINALVERCKELRCTSPALITPLFSELINGILLWTEQLETLPSTYSKMVFAVVSLQRAVLELDALYNYTTIHKPRMDNYMNAPPAIIPVAQCVGAFTTVPIVAQQLSAARLPFWFLRPSYVFDAEDILAVVPLQEPSFYDECGEDGPPIVYSGNSTSEKIAAIHRAAVQTPWYRDPFEAPDTRAPSPSPPPVAQPSGSTSSSRPVMRSNKEQARFAPYPPQSLDKAPVKSAQRSQLHSKPGPKAAAKNPPKIERDKFSTLAIPEMPPSIVTWADALAQVDRSLPPLTSDPADKRYVLPEPALFANSNPVRRRRFLHHWSLLSDGFIYMLSQPEYAQLLSGQEWRDVLEGLMTKRGNPSSRAYRRSANLESRIRLALQACNISSLEGFPVPDDSLPEFSLEQTREIVWQVAEMSFRFELAALDRRASKKERLGAVKECFAGHMLIGVPLQMSKRGWAATEMEERHRYVARTANLMFDWTSSSPRPDTIGHVAGHSKWTPSEMQAHYTQCFWEYFGRAAVVPLRLDHDVEKEDGQL
ncbi:hypothetical protein B0H13DRAFT_2425711 [Mycena leptocephala]|nr:hypothetical protein B0H13DRAFT_2425711 [Mycena leptocephala]